MPTEVIRPLSGKLALVVGASRGIGLAIARDLARAGARTTLASRDLPTLEKEAEALTTEGMEASAMHLDVNNLEGVQFPEADILVNVSGTNNRKPFEQYSREEFASIMQTNLNGLVDVTQNVGRRMIDRKTGGKIIFIGSMMSLLGLPYLTAYAMSKSALAGLTRSLAAEWGKYNIQVNCIAPGFILTALNHEMWQRDDMKKWLAGAQANPRMGSPEDIAPLATFLSGAGADYITGQVIAVDGGYTTTAVWPFEPS